MENLIKQQIEKNKELLNQGRAEGMILALLGGLTYLIIIAAVIG